MPGATDKVAMKLMDVLGRLLLLALRKAGSAARFCVAAGAVASLAGEQWDGAEWTSGSFSSLGQARARVSWCQPCPPLPAPAESALASQTVGSTRHGSSADVDRVLGVLAAELGGLVEGNLRAAERCAVIEALLYLQVGGVGLWGWWVGVGWPCCLPVKAR